MFMKMHTVITAFLYFAFVSSACAHALWIETEPNASIGKPHHAKVFYGEYSLKEFEKTDKWYADVNTFVLWLTAPDGRKTQLTRAAAADHYTASFTPDQKGTYVLSIGHSAGEVSRGYVYQFNASAAVTVGNAVPSALALASTELYLQTEKGPEGKYGIVKAYYKGQPASDISVTVSGPSGWSKVFKTDKDGVLQFELLWKGTFALEGVYTSNETGTIAEKNYEHVWRCATTRFESSN
jgi:uncharacterized GH25 family protein